MFLKSLPDRWIERDRLADLRVRFIDDTGAFFDARPYRAAAYRDQTPIMHEIHHEGLKSMTPQATRSLDNARQLTWL